MYEKLLSKIKNVVDIKLLKFIIVGVINTIIGMFIMLSLYNWFEISYWISSGANYFLTSILSYFLNKTFTFQNKDKSWKIKMRFVINILICYVLAYGIAKPIFLFILSGQSQKTQENVAMIVGMLLFTGFNFLGQRFYAFKTTS